MADLRKIMEFYMLLDGTQRWDKVRPGVGALFHDECRMYPGCSQFLNKTKIFAMMQELVEDKAHFDIISIQHDGVSVRYEYTVAKHGQAKQTFRACATFREGKVYHLTIEKADSSRMAQQEMKWVSAPAIRGF